VDTKMANHILELFRELTRNFGLTVVVVTHDPQLAKKVDRVVAIRDGKASSEIVRRTSYAQELLELEQGMRKLEEEAFIEYAVMDKAGRLQIPKSYLDEVGAGDANRMQVSLVDGKIVLTPAKTF